MQETILHRSAGGDQVQCLACKLFCSIKEGRAGLCGVRINKKGMLYLLVYGKAAAVNVDPIEKKPLYHFLPGTDIFSLGTIGCNFGCSFCQNWDISQVSRTLRRRLKKQDKQKELVFRIGRYGYDLSPERITQICLNKQLPAIAYTYNEPVIFFEYVFDTAELATKHSIKNVFVSNGYESKESLDLMGDRLNAMNIDLKSFRDSFYKKHCKARLQPVLDTIEDAFHRDIWLEITTLIIPGENDSDGEIKAISSFIASCSEEIPWHISRFHPAYKMRNKEATSESFLVRAYEIARNAGLKYVYLGNVRDRARNSTYCPNCNELLISRTGYHTNVLAAFRGDSCVKCKEKIAGVWN